MQSQWPDMPVPNIWEYLTISLDWLIAFILIAIAAVIGFRIRANRAARRKLPGTVAELRAQQRQQMRMPVLDAYHRHYGLGMDDDEQSNPWPHDAA